MFDMSQNEIRIPIFPTKHIFVDDLNFSSPSQVSYSILTIDLHELWKYLFPHLSQFKFRNGYKQAAIMVGRDILSELGKIPQDALYNVYQYMRSEPNRVQGFGLILNGESLGVNFIPLSDSITRAKRELTDRERMSTAHFNAVVKITAEYASRQRGEYQDGFFACIRVMCQNLGVEVPEGIRIPFQGMKIADLSERVYEEMHKKV